VKVLTISLSENCVMDPPCTFCFQVKRKSQGRLNSSCWHAIKNLVDEKWKMDQVTICYEYSGYNLSFIEDYYRLSQKLDTHWTPRPEGQPPRISPGPKTVFTMTTMPSIVTENLISYIREKSPIGAIALSYNSQVVSSPREWAEKASLLKRAGFRVSCNQLLENIRDMNTPREVVDVADQINLLSLKPTGKLSESELALVRLHIFSLNPKITVTVDNCLGLQLGYIDSCRRGVDFLHVNPDGTFAECCFKELCFLYPRADECNHASA
jgi:hypothetical protein